MREFFQTITRSFGLLNKFCCSVDGLDFSVVQSHILYEIETKENPSIQQVADLLGIDVTTFSRQVQTLVKMDLVKKISSPEDKRVTYLALTEKGKGVAKDIDRQVNDYLTDIFLQMNDFERDTVQRSIILLADVMNRSRLEDRKDCEDTKC